MTENLSTTAATRSYKSGIQTWSLVVAILIVLPGAYAFLYFTDRDDYLTNRYFRALGELDRQVNQGLTGLDGLLGFALDPEISPDRCRDSKVCETYQAYLRQFSQQFAQVKFGNMGACGTDSADQQVTADKTFFYVGGVPDNRKVVAFECAEIQCKMEPCPAQRRWISASVSIGELIDPAAALLYFDQVLLLDADGEVIYRSGKDDLASTENIGARDDYARFENLGHYLRTEIIRTVDLSSGLDGLAVNKKTEAREVSHSTIREATIGNVDYLLFIQPFHAAREQAIAGQSGTGSADIPAAAAKSRAGRLAYLVGVVPYHKHFLDIVSLPLWQIANLVLVFLFLLALVPHLKLYFSGSYFMPNRVFAWWIGITFPLLALFIWETWFAWNQYVELKNSMDQEARSIARKIQENYQWEIGRVMEAQKAERLKSGTKHGCQGDRQSKSAYPAFGVAFFLDQRGQIVGCSKNHRTVEMKTETSVDKRNYFSIPVYHPERLYSWLQYPEPAYETHTRDKLIGTDAGPIRYYSERIQSYDHGLKLTALSFPVENRRDCPEDHCAERAIENAQSDPEGSIVLVLVKLMQTFFTPVLPFGFGFAVIDDHSGEVYYHSNDQRSLLENFYIETDRNTQLVATVRSRQSEFVSGIYNAEPHRFFIAPLEGTPWSLIVFYDIGSIDLVCLRTVLQSLIYAAAVTLMLFSIPLVTRLIFPRTVYRPLRTLLPNGIIVRQLHASLRKTALGRLTDQCFAFIYVGSATTLVFSLFGIVAWFTFSHASTDQIQRLQRFNLLYSGKAILNRMEQLELERQRLGVSPRTSAAVKYVDDRELSEFSIYYPQHFKLGAGDSICGTEMKISRSPRVTGPVYGDLDLSVLIDRFLPVFNRFDASYLQMRNDGASDGSWFFGGPSSESSASLCLRNDLSGRYTRIASSHTVPHRHSGSLDAINEDSRNSDCTPGSGRYAESLCHGKTNHREISLFVTAVLGLFLLYQLAKQSATRLMGLYLPEPHEWAEHQMIYQREPPIEPLTESTEDPTVLARKNLATIANGNTLELRELRAMLYNRAHDRIINTYQVTPVMWLILSGILNNENGHEFRDNAMKKWIEQQPWRQETRDFYQSQSTDLWRILAPSFYALLLLGLVLITLSGGKIGDFLIGMLPIALAGGIPALVNLVRERLK